jgi:hypothetical protein
MRDVDELKFERIGDDSPDELAVERRRGRSMGEGGRVKETEKEGEVKVRTGTRIIRSTPIRRCLLTPNLCALANIQFHANVALSSEQTVSGPASRSLQPQLLYSYSMPTSN